MSSLTKKIYIQINQQFSKQNLNFQKIIDFQKKSKLKKKIMNKFKNLYFQKSQKLKFSKNKKK